jgi:DNA-binding XRE family transcriptional regulator
VIKLFYHFYLNNLIPQYKNISCKNIFHKSTESRQLSIVQLSTKVHLRNMEDISVKFGKRVKELRITKGYSQEKLADISDLDRTYIPGIEAGKRNVSLVVVEKIAKAFSISLSELLNQL